LLLHTDNATFAALVPYLILLATCLFIVQEPLSRWQRRRADRVGAGGQGAEQVRNTEYEVRSTEYGADGEGPPSALSPLPSALRRPTEPYGPGSPPLPDPQPLAADPHPPTRWAAVLAFQFLIGVYGGYFGAGIGILMLAAFAFLGFTNIHHMNALKNLNNMCINGVAATLFIAKGLVDWRLVLLMAAGAIVGGYAGAGTARRVGQKNVRRMIIAIGFALSIWLLVRQMS
jgi:hypothetical protein